MRTAVCFLLNLALTAATLVPDVRRAIEDNDFSKAERLIEQYRSSQGVTPEMLLAQSWLGRGALAAKRYDEAERYASKTKSMAEVGLRSRKLEGEPDL